MHVKVFDIRELLLIHLGVIILWVWVGCFFFPLSHYHLERQLLNLGGCAPWGLLYCIFVYVYIFL